MSTFGEIVQAIQKISPSGIDEWKVIEKIHKNPDVDIKDILIDSLIELIANRKNDIRRLKGEEEIPYPKKVEEVVQIKKESTPSEEMALKEEIVNTTSLPFVIESPPVVPVVIENKDNKWRNARKIDPQSLFKKRDIEAVEKIASVIAEKRKIEPIIIQESNTTTIKEEEEKIEIIGDTNLIRQIMEMGPFENYQEYQRKYVSKILKELVRMCDMALQDKKLNEFREIGQIERESISLNQLVETLFMENHKLVRFWEVYNDQNDYRLSKKGMDLFEFILENHDFSEYLSLLTPQLVDTYEFLS